MSYRLASTSPGKYAGQDNGWMFSLVQPVLIEFDKSILKPTAAPIIRKRRTKESLTQLGMLRPHRGHCQCYVEPCPSRRDAAP